MKGLTPRRGEVWLVNFNPGRGSEQRGVRPALLIQNDTGNIYASTTIVAAITSTIKEFPVTVVLSPGEGGLKQRSMINLAQLLTIDKGRLQKRLGHLSDAVMEQVNEAVRVSLDV
jgi:mRNA interferase MazF